MFWLKLSLFGKLLFFSSISNRCQRELFSGRQMKRLPSSLGSNDTQQRYFKRDAVMSQSIKGDMVSAQGERTAIIILQEVKYRRHREMLIGVYAARKKMHENNGTKLKFMYKLCLCHVIKIRRFRQRVSKVKTWKCPKIKGLEGQRFHWRSHSTLFLSKKDHKFA